MRLLQDLKKEQSMRLHAFNATDWAVIAGGIVAWW